MPLSESQEIPILGLPTPRTMYDIHCPHCKECDEYDNDDFTEDLNDPHRDMLVFQCNLCDEISHIDKD